MPVPPAAALTVLASGSLLRGSDLRHLFDRLPDVVFFIKDRHGRYLAANRTLAERCGSGSPDNLRGRTVRDLFPDNLAARYAAQDELVIRTGRPIIDRLELHWHRRGHEGWCLTTKLALRSEHGDITGLIGISRDLRQPGDKEGIPASITAALDHLDVHYRENLTPADLAARAAISPARFARIIKRVFRLSPVQLICQTRLAAAARLLTESCASVSEIALDCGFCDHSAFTRAFRSAAGVTPTEFRRLPPGLTPSLHPSTSPPARHLDGSDRIFAGPGG